MATRPRLLLAAGLAVLGEVGLRALFGWLLVPPAVVCWPPVLGPRSLGEWTWKLFAY
jgi:hypothetical protein